MKRRTNGCHLDIPRTVSSQCVIDDGDIAATVKDAISCITIVVLDGKLKVAVKNGWVTLGGTLGDSAQRECVEHIVLHSIGVRGVVNSISVG